MKRLSIALAVLAIFGAAHITRLAAADTNQKPFPGGYLARSHALPTGAVIGSNAARQAAFNSFSAQQKAAINAKVQSYFNAAYKTAMSNYQASMKSQNVLVHDTSTLNDVMGYAYGRLITQETELNFTNASGATVPITLASASGASKDSTRFASAWWEKPSQRLWREPAGRAQFRLASYSSAQFLPAETDGLPDTFKSAVADAFTPFYFVSVGEPDNFATFLNQVPEVVAQTFGPNPLSYYRVQPLGFVNDSAGTQYGALRIDYLTLWDQDSGLVISNSCFGLAGLAAGILGIDIAGLLDGLSGHPLDDEHSAALVLAPTSSTNTYNLTAASYEAYSYYTAAHEGTFFDHSAFWDPSSPVASGLHIDYALSLSKHSTYPFNPDFMPLFPDWLISAYYATVLELYDEEIIDEPTELYLQFVGDTLFFDCVVEHFTDKGGVYATPRINVGEPVAGEVENQCGFILDPNHVLPKLDEILWYIVQSSPGNFSLTAKPSSHSIAAGSNTTFTATVTPSGGFFGTVPLSVTGLPVGASGVFSPAAISVSGGTAGSSTLTISTLALTAAGTYSLTLTGTDGSLIHTASVSLVVQPPPPDFSVLSTPASQATVPAGGTNYNITVVPLNGFSATVDFTVSGLPSGATGVFSPATVTGSGSTALDISTLSSTPLGVYSLTITATSGSLTHTLQASLDVANYAVVHTFTGPDGNEPWGDMAIDSAGNVYGTTRDGGTGCPPSTCGVIFKINPFGNQTVLYSFKGGTDGSAPGGLTIDSAGNLYGTTGSGGDLNGCGNSFGCGTVFKLSTSGIKTTLYSFPGGAAGYGPVGDLILDSAGNLYGATEYGGDATGICAAGCGIVYKLSPAGAETVIYTFPGNGVKGAIPLAGLARDSAGNFYGTTIDGGNVTLCTEGYGGCGVVYKLTAAGTETVLHAFTPGVDGSGPWGPMAIDFAGNLYGANGSQYVSQISPPYGGVFKIDPTGEFTALYTFTGSDGTNPIAGLILDPAGNLYGTNDYNGSPMPTVFKLDPAGNETVLYTFSNSVNGESPAARLVRDSAGNLYGSATGGGVFTGPCEFFGCGVVFKVVP